jgi:hypothetical protein
MNPKAGLTITGPMSGPGGYYQYGPGTLQFKTTHTHPTLARARCAEAILFSTACSTVRSQTGFSYVVEAAPLLLEPPAPTPWVPVSTNQVGGASVFQLIALDTPLFPQRSYHIVLP